MNTQEYNRYNSQAHALSFSPEDQVAPEPGFTDKVGQRLSTLLDIIGETNGALASLSDRVLGPMPRGIPGSGSTASNKANGRAAELVESLDSLVEMARQGLDEARALNSRI